MNILNRREFLTACGVLGLGASLPLVAVDALAGTDKAPQTTRTWLLMGTLVSITASGPSADQCDDAIHAAFGEMQRLCTLLDRHDPSTPMSLLNREGMLASPPPELRYVLANALDMHALSGAAFDPAVLPVLELFKQKAAANAPLDMNDAEYKDALHMVDASAIHLENRRIRFERSGLRITLDGLAKGYIADQAARTMRAHGVENFLINAGGDIVAHGGPTPDTSWKIAIEDPAKHRAYPAVFSLRNGAVATSGNYEIYFAPDKSRHHLIDPASGRSPSHHVSATVRAATAREADALSTALMVMRTRQALQFIDSLPGRECCIISRTGVDYTSRKWAV